jgi:RimJ/RimL family protein N-acetyltransferase
MKRESILKTQRLDLRCFVAGDARAMEGVFCDPEVMYSSDNGAESAQWVREFLTEMIEENYPQWGFGLWAVEERATREVIGYCGLSRCADRCGPDEAEIGYRLVKKHWRQGFATEAAAAVCEHGLKTIGLSRIVAIVEPDNVSSVHVLQKLGMRYQREIMFDGYTHPDHLYVIP